MAATPMFEPSDQPALALTITAKTIDRDRV